MIELFSKGGWVMYPLFLSSIFALAVVIERLWVLRQKKVVKPEIIAALDQTKSLGDVNLLRAICAKFDGPFAQILLTAIDNQDLPPADLRILVEDDGRQQVRVLENRLVVLETIASIAPLMGLFGTVLGMIKVFEVIQTIGVGQAKALSGGISEALLTTATGLIIGIPAVIAYNFFRNRSESLILDMEKYVQLLLNKLIRFNDGENAEPMENLKLKNS